MRPWMQMSAVYAVYAVVPGLLWLDAREGPVKLPTYQSSSTALDIIQSTVFKPIAVSGALSFIVWLASWHSYAILFPLRRTRSLGYSVYQLLLPFLAAALVVSAFLMAIPDVLMVLHDVWGKLCIFTRKVDTGEVYQTAVLTAGYVSCFSAILQVLSLCYSARLFKPDSWTIFDFEDDFDIPAVTIDSELANQLRELHTKALRDLHNQTPPVIDEVEEEEEEDKNISFVEAEELARNAWGEVVKVTARKVA
ncbi:uncharacterized protein BDZ99DRAFT_475183 [Mytilinidion resinicola]|uniref:Uncharacterized protein n=1 Tax=Mytilinidion resinicola TaxID=574789 RepID=A0A6A6YUK7_9PEZI|nr:uncharacterized protein BDZ99DRAFT_475183 [Mytilinidion resinicola]KAF2811655.1 hypothetical protein BDZ99DRAFT_475183 [Mytilinidion resinicola]